MRISIIFCFLLTFVISAAFAPVMAQGDGEDAEIPPGFVNGKKNGRVYFIRLKHGADTWNNYADGPKRLLAFMNIYFACQNDIWPMTAPELYSNYVNKNAPPSFLYLYCDNNFSLSPSELIILRSYINKGGFLFLDSAPGQDVYNKVALELQRVLPNEQMTDIPPEHKINSFLFQLDFPGIGLNTVTQRNYGITRDEKLLVFYSMGDSSIFYNTCPPDPDFSYALAQYQMGLNVIFYAITHGDDSGMTKRTGANARITQSIIDQLAKLFGSVSSPNPNIKPDEPMEATPPAVEGEPIPN